MGDTDMARGPLTPSPPLPLRPSLRLRLMLMPTTAMVVTALAMEATAMEVLATDTARGPLMPMPTTAMVDTALAMEATAMADMAAMAVTALATAMDTATARGLLMLMPMPTTAMVDTAWLRRLRPWIRPWIRLRQEVC